MKTKKKKKNLSGIQQFKRIPVIYKNRILNPCTVGRAYYLVKTGRAIFVKDKYFGTYLKMKKLAKVKRGNKKPRSNVKFSLGIDPGTMFTGFSVTSKYFNFNFELENTLIFEDMNKKTYFKDKTDKKNMYKRLRRSRLRHRKMRIDNRTGKKITYTSNYYYQNIINFVERITRYYNVKYIAIEDVSFNHSVENPNYKKGKSFSNLEVNKTRLYEALNKIGKLYISTGSTKDIRLYLPMRFRRRKRIADDMYVDLKTKNKSAKNFYAHCLDSFCLSCIPFKERYNFNPEFLYIKRRNTGIDKIRRKLERIQTNPKNNKLRRVSKLRKLRHKPDITKSNHVSSWRYRSNENYRERTTSKYKIKYGSSFYLSDQGNKNGYIGHKKGENKYKDNKLGYLYYEVQKIKPSKVQINVSRYFSCQISDKIKSETIGRYKKSNRRIFKK